MRSPDRQDGTTCPAVWDPLTDRLATDSSLWITASTVTAGMGTLSQREGFGGSNPVSAPLHPIPTVISTTTGHASHTDGHEPDHYSVMVSAIPSRRSRSAIATRIP